ncbi:MAG: flotillin family protein [Streptococcaceae bacterium]|jgi:flotillin|nr:flotillin family protein [Streptococcaceae bacterium]
MFFLEDFIMLAAGVGVGLIVIVLIIAFIKKSYQTALPNEAVIISGSLLGAKNVNKDQYGNKVKILRGGGSFVLPIIQESKSLSLMSSKIDVSTVDVYTIKGVPVTVNGVVVMKVGSSIEEIATAAEHYLGKGTSHMEDETREVLEGHLRAIIGSMTVEELYRGRDEFAEKVQEIAATDLAKMGLAVISFTVKDISDKNGYLDALGRPEIASVKRNAMIAEAEANKETRIKTADAEQIAKEAELRRLTEIAESEKLNVLKIAEFKKEQDTAKAEADQAYKIQEAKSMKETTDNEMLVEITRRQRQIELEEKEIQRKEKEYDATVRKNADATRYAQEQKAQADKAIAIAKAEAEAETRRLAAEALRLEAQAEAMAIDEKGKAEARALELKAEAMTKLNEAGKLNMILEVLPQVVAATAENLGQVDSINLYGGDGANTILGMPETTVKRSLDVLGQFGIDVPELMNSFASKGGITIDQAIDMIEE